MSQNVAEADASGRPASEQVVIASSAPAGRADPLWDDPHASPALTMGPSRGSVLGPELDNRIILRTDHHTVVIPAKAGTQLRAWGPRFRGDDDEGYEASPSNEALVSPQVLSVDEATGTSRSMPIDFGIHRCVGDRLAEMLLGILLGGDPEARHLSPGRGGMPRDAVRRSET